MALRRVLFPAGSKVPPAFQFQQASLNIELQRRLVKQFGMRCVDLYKKYGCAELIYDDEGNIVGLAPPTEYLKEADDLALHLFMTESDDPRRKNISATALSRIALAQSSFYASVVERLRTDPSYLREQIELLAARRYELLPDANGDHPTLESLLADPRFVGQQTRFIIHNNLQDLGYWSIVAEYLKDIADLDEKKGRFGAQKERQKLMNYVAGLVDHAISIVTRRVKRGIVTDKKFGKFWRRSRNYPDYRGAECYVDEPELRNLDTRSFEGACINFALHEDNLGVYVDDFVKCFLKASDVEVTELNEFLYNSISQLKYLNDFLGLLDYTACTIPSTGRYDSFARNTKVAQQILDKAPFERHIKSIESISEPTVFVKLWNSVTSISQAECRTSLEKLVGFLPIAPSWHTPSPPSPSPSPPLPLGSLDLVSEPAPKKPLAIEVPPEDEHVQPPLAATKHVEPPLATIKVPEPSPEQPLAIETAAKEEHAGPAPIVVKPYYASRPTAFAPTDEIQQPVRKGPKVKTRPNNNVNPVVENDLALPQVAEAGVQRPTSPVLRVKKHAYDILENLLGNGRVKGQIDYRDFEKAMCALKFRLWQGSRGSAVILEPPSSSDPWFYYDRPHGRGTKFNLSLRGDIAKRLRDTYGWEWSWFALKTAEDKVD
ncbi:hypothetical protein Hypma_013915 [Hypsizygus marmoreus]|uniref:Uncharacterized protein n=1 Tax=Hypsizygus marmoreus TaxID=39966 RepID=A0A369KB22_HYPMA|nr:hypothetical protein Hypma_013915 [Hypsizygus marmoreus]